MLDARRRWAFDRLPVAQSTHTHEPKQIETISQIPLHLNYEFYDWVTLQLFPVDSLYKPFDGMRVLEFEFERETILKSDAQFVDVSI